jgi:hypothetical protein
MRKLLLTAATAALTLGSIPLIGTTAALAQIHVGPGGVRVGPDRPHCRTVTITEWRHGARVTRTERRCGHDWD